MQTGHLELVDGVNPDGVVVRDVAVRVRAHGPSAVIDFEVSEEDCHANVFDAVARQVMVVVTDKVENSFAVEDSGARGVLGDGVGRVLVSQIPVESRRVSVGIENSFPEETKVRRRG